MSTMICETREDAAMNLNEQNTEVRLSDVEISRRVLAIRSGWSISERVRRRNDANERFLDLMMALSTCDAA